MKKKSPMRTILLSVLILCLSITVRAQTATIRLNPPTADRGLSVMKAFALRASATSWDTTSLSLQDLSDLLWAAAGINRPESGKRTYPSAMNSQDIDVYVLLRQGAYLYDAPRHELRLIKEGDFRAYAADRQTEVAKAPVICLLVSDISRFKYGTDSTKLLTASIDAGIVSQNIALFCAGTGLATRPRASMNKQKLCEILQLKDTQHIILNNPVCRGQK